MKKQLLLLCFSVFALCGTSAVAPNWGVADTLEHHMLGPGIEYSKIYFRGKGMLIWVTKVDLNNPNNVVEQAQSRNQVPDVTRWTVPEFSKQNTRPGHKVCVAFNHDFFSYDQGIGIGVNISQGEITYVPWGRSILALDNNKRARVFYPSFAGTITLADAAKTVVNINNFNQNALGINGDVTIFNRFNKMTQTAAGTYIKIRPKDTWTVNGDPIRCEVLAISTTPIQSTETEYVILAINSKATAFDGKVNIGDEIVINQKFNAGKFGTPLTHIMHGFHGYPSIAYEGKLHDGEYNDFEGGREYEISSRVMAGHSQDEKTLYVVCTEMSNESAGVNCIDLANYMLSIGCWNVVNFDSGGSAAIVVNHEMLNVPARGSIRPVVDALLCVSTAPDSEVLDHYTFIKPAINPSIVSLTPLQLLSYNQYDEVLERDVKGFTFRCEPQNIGWVDENYIFHAGSKPIDGKIIAEKNGKTAEIIVRMQPASNISLTPNNILIDDTREYPISMVCTVGNSTFEVDPSAFTWTVTDRSICSVSNGVLKGIKNGNTAITGVLDDINVTLNVTVEIGLGPLYTTNFLDPNIGIKSSGASNIKLTANIGTPNCFTDGINLDFDFATNRYPFIELTFNDTLYGLPDSLGFNLCALYPKIVKELEIYTTKKSGEQTTSIFKLTNNSNNSISLPFATDGVAWPIKEFPVTLNKIKLVLDPTSTAGHYTLGTTKSPVYYPKSGPQLGVDRPTSTSDFSIVTFRNTQEMMLIFTLNQSEQVSYAIYDLSGRCLTQSTPELLSSGSNRKLIPISLFAKGAYIVQLTIGNTTQAQKIIIQ